MGRPRLRAAGTPRAKCGPRPAPQRTTRRTARLGSHRLLVHLSLCGVGATQQSWDPAPTPHNRGERQSSAHLPPLRARPPSLASSGHRCVSAFYRGSAAGPSPAAPQACHRQQRPGLAGASGLLGRLAASPVRTPSRGSHNGSDARRQAVLAQRHRAASAAATPCPPPRVQRISGGAPGACGATVRPAGAMLRRLVPRLAAAGGAASCRQHQGPPCSGGSSFSVPASPRDLPATHRAASLTTHNGAEPLNPSRAGEGLHSAARAGGVAAGPR